MTPDSHEHTDFRFARIRIPWHCVGDRCRLALLGIAAPTAHPSYLIQAGYGVWMTVTTVLWFSFVALVFTRAEVRQTFLRHGHWLDLALGAVFLGFAASLLWIS